jgi:hypothetical protein
MIKYYISVKKITQAGRVFILIESVFGAHALEKSKITVVGAGPAGLLTAYRLAQASLNVSVVEARSRIGGRLFSAPSIQAEFGAWSLANGGKPELFVKLAQELDLEIDNWVAPFKRLSIVNNHFSDITYRFVGSYHNDPLSARKLLESIILVSNTVQDVLDHFYQHAPLLKKISGQLFLAYHGSLPAKLSAPLYKESIIQLCLGGVSNVYKQGTHYAPLTRITGGNDLLTDRLASSLKDRIEFNKPLVAIKKGIHDQLILHFKDGTASETDILVLALPVAVYNDITFEEGLVPQDRLTSIRSICPGNITKVLIPALGTLRPPGFITTEDFGAAMSEHERFLTLYWKTHFTVDRCKEYVASIAKALHWQIPTEYIHIKDTQDQQPLPQDAVYIIDWVNTLYSQGSFCAYSPANEPFVKIEKVDGILVNGLFKPAGSIYFAGEGAGISTPPGTVAAAFESAEQVAHLITQRLLYYYQAGSLRSETALFQ